MTETRSGPLLQVRLTLPYPSPPAGLSANHRVHWAQKNRSTAQVRRDVTLLATGAGLHRYQPGEVEHVTVELVWAPGDRRRRDEDNLAPLLKAAADALARGRADLVGIDLVEDDTARWMAKSCRIEPPPTAKGMWLDLSLRLARPEVTG